MIRRIVTTYVLTELSGLDIVTAASARQALALLEQEPYDLVMCPRTLPDGDAPGLLRRMRRWEHLARTPVILMTPGDDPLSPAEAEALGVVRELPVPFDARELREAVQAALDPRRARRYPRIGLEGAEVQVRWPGGGVRARLVNIGRGGLLCQVEECPGRQWPLQPVELAVSFPARLGGGRALGIRAALARLSVLARDGEQMPVALRVAWEFLEVPGPAARVLETAVAGARQELERDRRRALAASRPGRS